MNAMSSENQTSPSEPAVMNSGISFVKVGYEVATPPETYPMTSLKLSPYQMLPSGPSATGCGFPPFGTGISVFKAPVVVLMLAMLPMKVDGLQYSLNQMLPSSPAVKVRVPTAV